MGYLEPYLTHSSPMFPFEPPENIGKKFIKVNIRELQL